MNYEQALFYSNMHPCQQVYLTNNPQLNHYVATKKRIDVKKAMLLQNLNMQREAMKNAPPKKNYSHSNSKNTTTINININNNTYNIKKN